MHYITSRLSTEILNKLQGVGIRGIVHKWFVSYLKNRVQCVEIEYYDNRTGNINKVRSSIINVKRSIPQGSVLGCILFLIYINDLSKIIDSPSVLFADDISVVFPCSSVSNCKFYLNSTLSKLESWLTDHNLQINYNKTKLMQFRPYQKKTLNNRYFI